MIKQQIEQCHKQLTPGIDERDGITLLNTIFAKLVANPEELNQNITPRLHNDNYHLQARLSMFTALFPLTSYNINGTINLVVYLNYSIAYESIAMHMHQMKQVRAIILSPGSITTTTLNDLLQAIENDINSYVRIQVRNDHIRSSRPTRNNSNIRTSNNRRTATTTESANNNTSNTGPRGDKQLLKNPQ